MLQTEDLKLHRGILRIKASDLFESQPIFKEIFIVGCRYTPLTKVYVYDCYSKYFRPMKPGYLSPEYKFINGEFLEVKE